MMTSVDMAVCETFARITLEPGVRPGTFTPIGHADPNCAPNMPTVTCETLAATNGDVPWPCNHCVSTTEVGRVMSAVSAAEVNRLAPEYRAPGTKLRGRQYGNGGKAPATRAQKNDAERAGVSVAGQTRNQATKALDKVLPATDKQCRFVIKLVSERKGNPAADQFRAKLNASFKELGSIKLEDGTPVVGKNVIRECIDGLIAIPVGDGSENATVAPSAPVSAPQNPSKAIRITNRYAGKCGSCEQKVDAGEGIWQLDDQGNRGVFHLDGQCPLSDLGIPTGRYAVEHEGTLKFYVIKPNGLFVMASDEEHRITKKDRQIEIAELIKIDPMAAMRRYGHEIGRCGRCGRTLTDEVSRANGIGPICESKAFG